MEHLLETAASEEPGETIVKPQAEVKGPGGVMYPRPFCLYMKNSDSEGEVIGLRSHSQIWSRTQIPSYFTTRNRGRLHNITNYYTRLPPLTPKEHNTRQHLPFVQSIL